MGGRSSILEIGVVERDLSNLAFLDEVNQDGIGVNEPGVEELNFEGGPITPDGRIRPERDPAILVVAQLGEDAGDPRARRHVGDRRQIEC